MRDIFAKVGAWSEGGRLFSLATLVGVRNAAPAPLGTSMAVTEEGVIAGDIGGGCYEGEIIEAAMATARDGVARVLAIDLSGDDVLLGGSGCGGVLDVVTWRPPADFHDLANEIVAGRSDVTWIIDYERDGRARQFTMKIPKRRELIVVGATILAQELALIAKRLDFSTVVVDPRAIFATPERLGAVDRIVIAWPQQALPAMLDATTPLVVVSHDPKIDLPALREGVTSESPYIGLLGSRRAQRARRAALRAEGFNDATLARIHGPAGLDIGGTTSAETAVSIIAEIVATGRERSGIPLVRHEGAIHTIAR